MKIYKAFLSALLAGMSVGFGGLVYLSVEDRVLGAALFTIGLFVVCTFSLELYTGRICYVFQNDRAYALRLPFIWLGNLLGTGVTAGIAGLTRIAPALSAGAQALCQVKLADSLPSLFFLGMLCNMFIYIAVEGYKNAPYQIGKYVSLLLGVMVFILSGTEHCVADMFYLWMGGAWSARAALCIITITLGNSLGGLVFPLIRSLAAER